MALFNLYKTSDKTQFYWTLEADNGEVVATSETYTTKQAAKDGIASVKRIAPNATIIDVAAFQ
ncbi:hypothetical protein C1N74_07600 [Microbacterium sp. SGAir0570]|uniref:YegP family protein n=1 Tax=Microbacterium sp. SGAir0570 TaxID=2070348 RepID=UPI0010CD007D|nr:YegP family protein [Microbacterium sp. SGAir0570]QCR40297.1 hypothetical protein C1N74_07600 [Microbacterium sp. SGAir0570]